MDIIISSATHRSGSTLLQRLLNARKKTLIWGEQDGLLTHFYHIHKNLKHYSVDLDKQRLNYFNNKEDPNQWIACMNPEITVIDEAVANSVKALFYSLYEEGRGEHDLIGFKEVRYGEKELSLFRRCYPNTTILLLVRNPLDVWKSMLGAGLGDNVANFTRTWNQHTTDYLHFSKNDPLAFLIKYEDLINQEPATINQISELGQLTNEEMEQVLSKKISSTQKVISPSDKKFILDECGEIMKHYNYL